MSKFRNPTEGTPLRRPAYGFPLFYAGKRRDRVITADIWEFLRHSCVNKLKKNDEGPTLAQIGLAENLYFAAQQSPAPPQPLLYYYAFLNLAKVLLAVTRSPVPREIGHGLKDPHINNKIRRRLEGQVIRVIANGPQSRQLFPQLVEALNAPKPPKIHAGDASKNDYNLLALLHQVPAIHRTYCSVLDEGETFCPIRTPEILTSEGKVWVVLRFIRHKQPKSYAQLKGSGAFKKLFTPVRSNKDGEDCFESNPKKYHGGPNLDTTIGALADEMRQLGIWTIATMEGYRYYFNPTISLPKTGWFPQLAVTYSIMFYLGSIVRYKPYDYEMIETKYSWLFHEFLHTQSSQFLHIMASMIAETDVVSPHAITVVL